MAIETFDFDRQAGSAGTIEYRVRETQFGDGYAQAVGDGLHNKVQTWPLSFVGDIATIQPIIDFLDRQSGYKSFLWTPPGDGSARYFRAKKWTLTSTGAGVYNLSVEFKQVFSP